MADRLKNKAVEDIKSILSGTCPPPASEVVESANANSRSNAFAADEDIKISAAEIIHNASVPVLVEAALQREKGSYLTSTGALAVRSGAKTGRSPKDKRIVEESSSVDNVWWGPVNIKMEEKSFMLNRERAIDYLNCRDRIFVVDGYAGWDPKYRVKVRVLCSRAYHALFMKNMLGEMKKGILTYMMYMMPLRDQLCLHSSANEGPDGSVTVFFGLSGTGKTTLSADPRRALIGDDEHVWTDEGVFNVEGGCYAKCIALSAEGEPEIFNAIRFGAVVENVIFDAENREIDFDDISLTENTRCAYPLQYIPNAKLPAVSSHPNNVVLLTCDGFGVLPPVSRLTREQVIYHFISGYTSKMAGTEEGITKPVAAFSSCYGEPFLVWHPVKYATMLAEKLTQHNATAWLLNTGWVGGAKGKRCPLKYTRAIVDAIHSGELARVDTRTDPIFGLPFPVSCPGVPSELLDPSSSWADKAEFGKTQAELAALFHKNFDKYASECSAEVIACGPKV